MSTPSDGPTANRRRFAGILAGAGLLLAAGTRETLAGRTWCRTDPLVIIGGVLADVFVSGPLSAPLKVTGPNRIVVTVPKGVPALLVLNDPIGFGRGNNFRFAESRKLRQTDEGIEIKIEVFVPARSDAMPVRVEFAPRILGLLWPESAAGNANAWVKLRSKL
jgi:hypothetical protein